VKNEYLPDHVHPSVCRRWKAGLPKGIFSWNFISILLSRYVETYRLLRKWTKIAHSSHAAVCIFICRRECFLWGTRQPYEHNNGHTIDSAFPEGRLGTARKPFVSPLINPLTPNDPYRGRTAPLTSKRCILYIYSTNIGTEYFKQGIYSQFFLFKKQFVS